MENLSKVESFESFQVSKQVMNQVAGGRTKSFARDSGSGSCHKVIDNNSGEVIKSKPKDRYDRAGKCDEFDNQ
ncbi:hypothetical protein [Tenacibaculum singaporense]|uniref:Uncharacterized protein n=1 Tax=Tenacibaculum singaporense TaxID=2358479 RepID=A0A3S8R3G8_9FLAO|nr:hypothetical protein [Tenacibaculum singaporense]AZJ34393.1 hypothetical protein D6T69_02155 [Tenacibaculum singaporense]